MLLPLVEVLCDHYEGPSLENVLVIGVQHILETTHAMFRSLYKLGLKPQNISILGKCYSTCKEVYDEMIADGIDVDPNSFAYSSHQSYDDQFQEILKNFIKTRRTKLSSDKIEKIIILDDGGKCIQIIHDELDHFAPLVAVEQTTSGYEVVRKMNTSFPVINVARSSLKLELESPMIAEAAIERLLQSLSTANHSVNKTLIIGGGAIGQAAQNDLKNRGIQADIYDVKYPECSKTALHEILGNYNLILGCTGKTSIPVEHHSHLAPGTALASISSSDREFDAVHLRKEAPETSSCHSDLNLGNFLLIRNGFPVNFDGQRENIDPQRIQLTIALMTAGILQGIEQDLLTHPGIIPLSQQAVDLIEESFTYLCL